MCWATRPAELIGRLDGLGRHLIGWPQRRSAPGQETAVGMEAPDHGTFRGEHLE